MSKKRIPTGVQFLDTLLEGGQFLNGVYGLLGPIGGGKTTLATMIAIEGARKQFEQSSVDPHDCGRWVYFIVGQGKKDISRLAYSHLAKISRQSLNDPLGLTRQSQAREYEIICGEELFTAPGIVPSEWERAELAPQILGRFLCVREISHGSFGPISQRPLDYVGSVLAEIAQSGPIRGVVIDTVGTLVTQFIPWDAEGYSRRQSNLIRSVMSKARRQIAERFGCSVWLVQQLTGAANERSSTALHSHLDAAETRHFGDDLDCCIALGTRDYRSGCFLLHRANGKFNTGPSPILLNFDRNFASIVEASDYHVSKNLYTIVPDQAGPLIDAHTQSVIDAMPTRGVNEMSASQTRSRTSGAKHTRQGVRRRKT